MPQDALKVVQRGLGRSGVLGFQGSGLLRKGTVGMCGRWFVEENTTRLQSKLW